MFFAIVLASVQSVAGLNPTPSPSPTPRFTLNVRGSNVFVDQATGGPGTTPPEALRFANGSPVSPMSPYDWLTSAPVTPGVAGIAQYEISVAYRTPRLDFGASIGIGIISGSSTNALYWGEPLIPNLNDHALSRAVPYSILFPTHAGQDDVSVVNANVLNGSVSAVDRSWTIRGGYFDLTQTDRFVFAPPPLTSIVPSPGVQTAETLGPGIPSIEAWPASPTSLPLLGADGVWRRGSATLELTDALLPSPPNTNVRLTMGSLVLDRGDYGRFSFQLAHAWTTGDPISTTTFFGVDPKIYTGPQGRLFTSVLANQVQTIAGARAFFHPFKDWDALMELGRCWYDAGLVRFPGTQHFGNYEHFSIGRHFGKDLATLEYHRFDPTYATTILPYGIPENIWSIAWSWPGVWLKSTYQLVDNSAIGVNRAGFRFKYDHNAKALEVHTSFGDWRQLIPETKANASQVGFVDGFFLLQKNGSGTYGVDRQLGLYVGWHLGEDDLAFDGVEDYLNRPAEPGQPIDLVAIHAPQIVASWTHHFTKRFLTVGGYARYEMVGTWARTPVDAIYGSAFGGVQLATGPSTALLVELHRYALIGLPSIPGGLPPTMRGTAFIVDQRIAL